MVDQPVALLELPAAIARQEMNFPELQAALVELEPQLFALDETHCVLQVDMAPREMETGRTERGRPELKDAAL